TLSDKRGIEYHLSRTMLMCCTIRCSAPACHLPPLQCARLAFRLDSHSRRVTLQLFVRLVARTLPCTLSAVLLDCLYLTLTDMLRNSFKLCAADVLSVSD